MTPVNGILLIYRHPLGLNASTIMEHVRSFGKYSQFKVWEVNTEYGFPRHLRNIRFKIIVLHYSIFGQPYLMNRYYYDWLMNNESHKIAFFQDEYHYCQTRFKFLNDYRIDCVYTLLEPPFFQEVYGKYTQIKNLVYTLTSYVDDDLILRSKRMALPDEARRVDVGYRARPLEFYMGKGAREKTSIARDFIEHTRDSGLHLDIALLEKDRIYGEQWYRFLADCRAVLGVEAGVSIFDIEDKVRKDCDAFLASNPGGSFEDIYDRILHCWENNIYYRTISPRHFEAAALRVCQILFEGNYSGILKPMVHYIPLKKDFSNIDFVIETFNNKAQRTTLTNNAYHDLIDSVRFSYRRFIGQFDENLLSEGFTPEIDEKTAKAVTHLLDQHDLVSRSRALLKKLRYSPFPGRGILKTILKPMIDSFGKSNYGA